MYSAFWRSLATLILSIALVPVAPAKRPTQGGGDSSQNPEVKSVPPNTILVKGAWASASDAVTPVPEDGVMADKTYVNKYFGLTYALEPGWSQVYHGPPPSDSGYYVLAQLKPDNTNQLTSRGTILIAAQDLFFNLTPGSNTFELMNNSEDKLQRDYKVERPLAPVNIANHSFLRLDYFSPVAQLHWYVLATQIRCHMIQFIFTSGDTKLLESLIQDMNKIKLPAEASPIMGTGGGDVPVCIKDYARSENVIEKVDPIFTERRFNPIPVRITIDKDGKVKHVHFLSAFPDQTKSISEALSQWRFKPYLVDGKAVEVETGIMFGNAPGSHSEDDDVNE